jgi:hypothetical protein
MLPALRHALLIGALTAPSLVLAETTILTRPAHCEAVMTVQKRGCVVETIFRCGQGAAMIWRNEEFDAEGPASVSHSTADYVGIEYAQADGSYGVISDPALSYAPHPRDVIAKGTGTGRDSGSIRLGSFRRPVDLLVALTHLPDPLILDGVRLDVFDLAAQMKFPDPMPIINGTGKAYYDPVTGVLFSAETRMDWPPSDDVPDTPLRIILPGQPGFASTSPTFDCEQLS